MSALTTDPRLSSPLSMRGADFSTSLVPSTPAAPTGYAHQGQWLDCLCLHLNHPSQMPLHLYWVEGTMEGCAGVPQDTANIAALPAPSYWSSILCFNQV